MNIKKGIKKMEDEELVITEDPELPDKIHEEMMLGLI